MNAHPLWALIWAALLCWTIYEAARRLVTRHPAPAHRPRNAVPVIEEATWEEIRRLEAEILRRWDRPRPRAD